MKIWIILLVLISISFVSYSYVSVVPPIPYKNNSVLENSSICGNLFLDCWKNENINENAKRKQVKEPSDYCKVDYCKCRGFPDHSCYFMRINLINTTK